MNPSENIPTDQASLKTHCQTNGKRGVRWTSNEDQLLKNEIENCGIDWLEIALHIPNRNAHQCCQRWKRIKDGKSNKKKFWTQEEDDRLRQFVSNFGQDWGLIAQRMKGRTKRQCKDRFKQHLDTNLKNVQFSKEEDDFIYEQFLIIGSKWSQIANNMVGRSENQVKNRFYGLIRKTHLQLQHPYQTKKTSLQIKEELESKRNELRAKLFIEFENMINIQEEQNDCSQILSCFQYSSQILDSQEETYPKETCNEQFFQS